MQEKNIEIYTDGSSRGNPGPGGFGAVLIYGGHRKEISQGFLKTTNNRMELLAVIVALESLKNRDLTIIITSDSKYVVDSVEKKWILGWVKKNWKGVKNPDLWKRYLIVAKDLKIQFNWVRGHAGHLENERCDVLAVEAATGQGKIVDEGYLAIDSDLENAIPFQ